MKHYLFRADELKPGEMRSVEISNVRVVVLRTPEGELKALRDSCSHYGARLSSGTIEPMVVTTGAGTYDFAQGNYVLRCPWHGYEFDVDDGRCPADPQHARVRSYRVAVEDGDIVVDR